MKKFSFIMTILLISVFVLAACGGANNNAGENMDNHSNNDTSTDNTADNTADDTADDTADMGPTEVRWFVGLGAGSDEGTFAPQEAFVEKFNASQDDIVLVLEIVDNDVAFDTLATQIAAGNAPDIVGPVGIRGRDSFKGAWLDLTAMIEASSYDLDAFDPGLVDFYHDAEEGLLGIPFAIFPSFVIYNADLFDEAGLPYPPAAYGESYVDADGVAHDWTIDTVRDLSMQLSVDVNGVDASQDGFDPENIVQFGWQNLWTDLRGTGTMWGAGSLVDSDGNAQMPEPWVEGMKWTYDAWWTDWFVPNGAYGGADFLQGPGGSFSSGNLAMIQMHMWYVAPWALGDVPFAWNLAASPSNDGVTTAKMHADTFQIPKGAAHPDEAFEVLTHMLSEEGAGELLLVYGGMPARLSMQDGYFATYTEANFPGSDINWDVVVASMAYADNPNHESYMPSFQETTDRYNEFWNLLANNPGLDVDAEFEILLADLQSIFDAAE